MNEDTVDGKGSITWEGKISALVGGALTAVFGYLAEALSSFDITPLPDLIEPGVGGLIVGAVAWLSARSAPRR
jgi:hypothetical protein